MRRPGWLLLPGQVAVMVVAGREPAACPLKEEVTQNPVCLLRGMAEREAQGLNRPENPKIRRKENEILGHLK